MTTSLEHSPRSVVVDFPVVQVPTDDAAVQAEQGAVVVPAHRLRTGAKRLAFAACFLATAVGILMLIATGLSAIPPPS